LFRHSKIISIYLFTVGIMTVVAQLERTFSFDPIR